MPPPITSLLDHVALRFANYTASRDFYTAILKPLGASLAIVDATHIAFVAPSLEAVHSWYDTALKAGGKDNGKPGDRLHYHPSYYAAYVLDPSGHNIEVAFQYAPPHDGKEPK